jgi:hypothetical protein
VIAATIGTFWRTLTVETFMTILAAAVTNHVVVAVSGTMSIVLTLVASEWLWNVQFHTENIVTCFDI